MNHQIPAHHRNNRETSCVCVCVCEARTGRLLRQRQTGRRCLEACGVFFWRELRPDLVSFGAENKNIGSARLTATAHHLFVIACAAAPVYILQSVSTGALIRRSVPAVPSVPLRPLLTLIWRLIKMAGLLPRTNKPSEVLTQRRPKDTEPVWKRENRRTRGREDERRETPAPSCQGFRRGSKHGSVCLRWERGEMCV